VPLAAKNVRLRFQTMVVELKSKTQIATPVGRSLRPASSGKHHGDQNGADTNAPLAQSKASGDMVHVDAPLGAAATDANPSFSASTAFDLDQAIEDRFSLLLARKRTAGCAE